MSRYQMAKDQGAASLMFRATDRIMDEHGGDEAWNAGTSRQAVEDDLTLTAGMFGAAVMTDGVIALLEDENYHVAVRAILRARGGES